MEHFVLMGLMAGSMMVHTLTQEHSQTLFAP